MAEQIPVAVLIEELKSENIKKRVNSVRQLSTIAGALGKDRTRTELVPFLVSELVEDEDEVLAALADSIGDFVDLVGGPAYAVSLLPVIESLCYNEDTVVRDKTIEALKKILARLEARRAEAQIQAMVKKLCTGESYTAKSAATYIIPIVYQSLSPSAQAETITLYGLLGKDEVPSVRKAASLNLKDLLKLLPTAPENELVNMMKLFAKDEQDFVRFYLIEDLLTFARASNAQKQQAVALPFLRGLAEDPSWRIRYGICDKLSEIGSMLGKDTARRIFFPYFIKYLQDGEAELRNIACLRMGKFVAFLEVEDVLQKIIPLLKALSLDPLNYVRSALAGAFGGLAAFIGKKSSNDHLLPIYLTMLRDESPEVRVGCLASLEELSRVVGMEVISQSLLPTLVDLVVDKSFRIRVAACDFVCVFAKTLSDDEFASKLSKFVVDLINDRIFAVRDAAIKCLRNLAEIKGSIWTERNLLPLVLSQQVKTNYLHRMSTLFGLSVH
eukprot:TRINITY_DN1934_c0_g1_i5.p1 TRINITY_DN1934_c0_g1~~TRINITY_DN1934_c0_g1_i5.p1  ORF type:complete len:499 (+),score=139.99 TRINITY_DN1934_c0_g1_i5:144-1640(+)